MKLGLVLKKWREGEQRSVRFAAREIGIHHATLFRLEQGLPCDVDTLATVLMWLLDRTAKRKAVRP
jgi:hypothetical protein